MWNLGEICKYFLILCICNNKLSCPTILKRATQKCQETRTVNIYMCVFKPNTLNTSRTLCLVKAEHTYYAHDKCQIHFKTINYWLHFRTKVGQLKSLNSLCK